MSDYTTSAVGTEILNSTETVAPVDTSPKGGVGVGACVASAFGGLITGVVGTIAAIKARNKIKADQRREELKACIREVLAEVDSESEETEA